MLPASPFAIPSSNSREPRAITIRAMVDALAPSAIRTAISYPRTNAVGT